MLFCTYEFALFFVVVLVFLKAGEYWPISQNFTILLASNFFYGFWDWRFLALIWLSIFIDYSIGLLLGRDYSRHQRLALVTASACSNLGILLLFKYFNFFQDGLLLLLSDVGIGYNPWLLDAVLPIGISFYTFQTMSYSIDVYRRKIAPTNDLLVFAQFVCYFPQLVAGPIERAGRLIPQLQKHRTIAVENVLSGALLIVWGCFKKAVVADSIGMLLVDIHFDTPASGTHLLLAILGFSVQIYCD
jgi:D-alanyl-lipoteichoic acid acyltransferase DltB (MBOAT superfamily)